MAEAYDAAIRRRLGMIDDIGTSATQAAVSRVPREVQGHGRPGSFDSIPGGTRPGSYTPIGDSKVFGGGGTYRGPRGNQQALINFGRWLQGQGFRVSEHSAFNGGRRVTGGHSKNSRHYSDRAFDLNFAPGTSRREQQAIDRIIGLARQYGLRSIWRQPGHYNHAHIDY